MQFEQKNEITEITADILPLDLLVMFPGIATRPLFEMSSGTAIDGAIYQQSGSLGPISEHSLSTALPRHSN